MPTLHASTLLQRMGACVSAVQYVKSCEGKSFEETWHNARPQDRLWLLDKISDRENEPQYYVMPERVFIAIDDADNRVIERVSRKPNSSFEQEDEARTAEDEARTAELNKRMPWSRLAPYIKKLLIKLEQTGT